MTMNEWFFQGHFRETCYARSFDFREHGSSRCHYDDEHGRVSGCIPYFTSLNGVKFRRPVIPGDQLVMEVTLSRCGEELVS